MAMILKYKAGHRLQYVVKIDLGAILLQETTRLDQIVPEV